MVNLGKTNYKKELQQLNTLLDSCRSEEERSIIHSMTRSTQIARLMDPEEVKKQPVKKFSIKKEEEAINKVCENHISHKISQKRKKVRASVRIGLTEVEFTRLDKVFIRTFDSEFGAAEFVIDRKAEKCSKHQHACAIEIGGTRRIPLHQLFPYVRNVRTQTNDVIAKRKHIHKPLFVELAFKTCYKAFLYR
ncbi:hypothetical protein [Listeria monocytogenes]|uniref:hypothetical protein n=1 Tax=Listeria monocytogenes TaxID=1639 RepID=UPI0011EB0F9E|nr:hypothetical protein [Listeria monocytogenes]TYV31014.1 hypothetical protein FZ060_15350 [Listeria monocytogenes]